ncbi:unnamed protein product [Cylicocyclus nassatus]|uniref:Uncharacterized protein n=1 Tax=Cylicocyclus nassatus TaxID=53992 RepID=A0AA36DSG6_CYLNA|nr:unnamed protein product [Cylicocyclus nassatus]
MMPNGRANGVPEAQGDRDDRVALEVPNNEAAPNGQNDGDRIFGAANEAGDGENGELGMPNLGLPMVTIMRMMKMKCRRIRIIDKKVPHQRAKYGE